MKDEVDKKKLAQCATNTAKHLGSDGQAFGFIVDVSLLAVALAAANGTVCGFVVLRNNSFTHDHRRAFTQRLGRTFCM
jgi:Na+(H+)/acetate symporter ActP